MTQRFFIVGGEYQDTSFTTFADHAQEERYGPFTNYEEAKKIWQEKSLAKIDNACVRYTIVDEK